MIDILAALEFGSVINAVIFSFFLLFRKSNSTANKYLSFLLLSIGSNIMHYYLYLKGYHVILHHYRLAVWPNNFLFAPLLFFYIAFLTNAYKRFKPVYLTHFLPSAATAVFLIAVHFKSIVQGKMVPTSKNLVLYWKHSDYLHSLNFIQIAVYFVLILFLFRRYRQKLERHFSSINKRRILWLKVVVAFLLVIFILSMAPRALAFLEWDFPLLVVHHIAWIIFVYTVVFCGLRQPDLFMEFDEVHSPLFSESKENEPEENELGYESELQSVENVKYQRNRLKDWELEELSERLMTIMDTQKPYKDAEITLATLGEMLGTTTHSLSQLINCRCRMNFFNFINRYRVQEVKKMLIDPEYRQESTLTLGFEAGFNSKSAFYKFFKKYTGTTPAQYRSRFD